jgi:hypothetical protein
MNEINFDVREDKNGLSLMSENAPNGRYILKEDAKLKIDGKMHLLRKGTEWKVDEGTSFIMWEK